MGASVVAPINTVILVPSKVSIPAGGVAQVGGTHSGPYKQSYFLSLFSFSHGYFSWNSIYPRVLVFGVQTPL
jgi:hypothetical protein